MLKQPIHVQRFIRGLVTNRALTSVPFKLTQLAQGIQFLDALSDGANMEITPSNTLARRPGYTQFCSSTLSAETVNGWASAILGGVLYDLSSTTVNVYSFTSSTLTSIYTKTTTAQTFFQQVGNLMYMSDGASNLKWDGATLTNAGLVAPVNAPTIPNLNLYDTVGNTQTCHAWVPGAVYANTTGSAQNFYLLAPTGEIQWSVVPAGTTLQSQTSTPNWSAMFGVFGGVTKDGGLTWTNCGPIGTWAGTTAFVNNTYTSTSQFTAKNTQNTQTTSGSASFLWSTTATSIGFTESSGGTTGPTNILELTGLGFAVPTGATITGIQVQLYRGANRTNAVSDTTIQLLKAGTPTGNNKANAGYWPQILWNAYNIPLAFGLPHLYGSNTDLWGASWAPSDINNSGFGIKIVANQNSTNRTSAAITYNSANNNVTALFTISYTVTTGILGSNVYAQIIQDSNGNLQGVKTGGTSGGSAPAWATAIGSTTTDGSVTWQCLGTANQLPCLFSRTYAYGFHSSGPVNHLSTMSPLLVVQAPIIGNNVPIQGFGSNDTQVDSNNLYRTADGGSLLLYDTQTTNVNASTSWTINDVALDTDLNALLTGPVAHANDPPPVGLTLLAQHMGRLWGIKGNQLYFSAGPDCVNGDGFQAWPPANVFTLSGNGTGLVSTSQGLVVYSSSGDMSVVLGGPQTLSFWIQTVRKNFPVLSPNLVQADGDTMFVYTGQRQLWAITPGGSQEIGFDVAPTLAANFDPSASYLAIHRSGPDQGLFITDASSKMQRWNMNTQSWDPISTITGGIGAIGSIDTSLGTRSLVSAIGSDIVRRDPTTYSDLGTAYTTVPYGTVGCIPVSPAGEKYTEGAAVQSVIIQSNAVGTALAVSVLPDETSGTFTPLPNPVADPPQLVASTSINMQRYDWLANQAAKAALARFVQVKITLPATDTVKNEVYGLSLV